jgi:hypothetical protein
MGRGAGRMVRWAVEDGPVEALEGARLVVRFAHLYHKPAPLRWAGRQAVVLLIRPTCNRKVK